MENKCTLLIDGNWLLQSRFSVLSKNFKTELPDEIKSKSTYELVDLMAKSINVMLNRFKFIDNIILVSDGGSWRKFIEKPTSRKDIEYKGNREAASEYDWGYIWSALKILSNNFIKNNITYSCAKDIEGDDWIWYWSRKLNNKGINCIIWSSDNDLKQLVNNNQMTNSFTMWYNDRCGGFLHNSLNCDCENEDDMLEFFLKPPTIYNPVLESIKNYLKTNISYVCPSDIIIGKIICGDTGDNIKPVASYEKNGRTYNITGKMWGEISESCNMISIDNLINNENLTASFIKNYKKFKSESISQQEIYENILYNTKMVWLDKSIIPKKYIDIMDKYEYKIADLNYIKNNYKTLCDADKEVEKIFDEIEELFD